VLERQPEDRTDQTRQRTHDRAQTCEHQKPATVLREIARGVLFAIHNARIQGGILFVRYRRPDSLRHDLDRRMASSEWRTGDGE